MRLSFFQIKSKIYFKEMSMYNFLINICGEKHNYYCCGERNYISSRKIHVVDE